MVTRACISINNRCNLNCTYCHFHEKKDYIQEDNMDVITILDIIASHIEDNDIDLFKLGFVGNGEPMLDYEKLKQYIAHIGDYLKSGRIAAYTITNGLLVDREKLEFFKEYNVNVGFSVDGISAIHDKYSFFLLSILLFGIFKMVPGDPARLMVEGQKQSVSPEQYEMLYQQARVRLGLDKPIPVQYLSWMGNILQGDFGYSTVYRIPVKELIGPPMKNTIALNVVYYIFLFAIGIPLGIKCAVKKDTVFDTSLQVATMIGISIPSFISALIFIYLFAIKIPIFPISGMVTTGANFTGFRAFLDYLYHMALPIIVCLTGIGGLIRYVRGALLDALSMDYVRTARAKGLKEKTVIYKHAFRNAMIPITGWIVGSIVGIFGGAVIIETLFSWKGVGKLLIDSLNQHDYTVALSMQMFYILLGLAANLITDLCYCIVDPRIKLD